jgi:hypothetical protein
MDDESWKELVLASTDLWLAEQISTTTKLIHESEQLLRGQSPGESVDLKRSVDAAKSELKFLREELDRRKADQR